MNRRLLLLLLILTSSALATDFTITDQPAGPELVGFGAQMNPYLYCKPNEVSGELAADYERKVKALAPQHVRVFMLQHWFDGLPDVISKGDPKSAESFIRVCRLAQDAGATINLTNWYGPWTEPEKQMANLAAIIDRLINTEKLTAIRYVTVQNEPNLHEDKITKVLYARLYRALDADLKKRGLRERVKIISGDLVQDNQEAWFDHLATNLADVSDGYSIHAYWDYWDTPKIFRRLRMPSEIVRAMPESERRPLYVTEFGVRGHRTEARVEPGDHEDGSPIADKPLQANQLATFILEGLNRGYVAFVIWTMEDAWYDRLMPYGVIGSAKDGWPTKPSYHLLRLMTHTSKPGWHAANMTGEREGVLVAALRGSDGALTVYALNQTDSPSRVTVAGLPEGKTLQSLYWNAAGDGQCGATTELKILATGEIALDLAPLAMTVLTTEDLAFACPPVRARP